MKGFLATVLAMAIIFGVGSWKSKRQRAHTQRTIDQVQKYLNEKKEQEEMGWEMTRTEATVRAKSGIKVEPFRHPGIEVLEWDVRMGQKAATAQPEPYVRGFLANNGERDLVHLAVTVQYIDSTGHVTDKQFLPIHLFNRIAAGKMKLFDIDIGKDAPPNWSGGG